MYDVIVCGAGVQGLSTANYLVENKKKVLVIEQFHLPHVRGSSHGASRITRHSYDKSYYSQMMPECFDRWEKLAKKTDLNLFNNCGLMTVGDSDYVKLVEDNLKAGDIKYEIYDDEGVKKRFPGFSSGKELVIYEPSGGILIADRCLQALQRSIISGGGEIQDGEKVISIEEMGGQFVRITTNKSVYSTKKLVLTCGSWINKVIKPFGIQYPVKPVKINVLYWKAKDPTLYDIKRFPGVYIGSKHHFYSLPIMEYPQHMKVCFHYGVTIDPDQPAKISKSDEVIRARQYQYAMDCVRNYYPELEEDPGVQENCIYTVTPDWDLILETLPGHSNIVVGAGFSGHGFKLAPAVGHILGDLALDRQPPYSLAPFSSERFKKQQLTSKM